MLGVEEEKRTASHPVLWRGNCLDLLRGMPDGAIDAVVTDPPYGIAYRNQRGATVLNDKSPFIWWLYDAYRATRDGGCLVCFTRWDVQEAWRYTITLAGWQVKSQVIWDRQVHGMGDTKAAFSPRHDVIWFAVKGRFQFPGKRPASVVSEQRLLSNLVHPTQKPVALMEQLIRSVTPEGGVVLDPCMGSGSTGVAAVQSGCRFIGAELDAEHFETAHSRIGAAMMVAR